MKKITSLILAMAMVFSLSAQVFALNDDMQDNENSEANMIVITTSKEERDKQFKEAIDEGNICLDKMSDPWFLDADYKAMALIEGKNIKA